MAQEFFRRKRDMEGDDRPGRLVIMKTDKDVEKARTA
jgi:hypothetical protein